MSTLHVDIFIANEQTRLQLLVVQSASFSKLIYFYSPKSNDEGSILFFLARLHFSAEELLLYPRHPCPRPRRRQRRRPQAKC